MTWVNWKIGRKKKRNSQVRKFELEVSLDGNIKKKNTL